MLSGGVAVLNWKPDHYQLQWKKLTLEDRPERIQIEVQLRSECWAELQGAFALLAAGEELQCNMGQTLVVFIRPSGASSDSRILVARPEENRLVCTCILSPAALEGFESALMSQKIAFHQLGRLHFLSNLEMVWKTSIG